MSRVVIVGGGIAGLAAALRLGLQPERAPHLSVTVLDAGPRWGGTIRTERIDGFVIEAGPDSFLASRPRGLGLCRELGLEAELIGINARARRARVLRGGRLHELPEGLTGLVPSRLGPILRSGLLSPLGKLRLALDFVIPGRPSGDEESLASFIRRRLGAEAYDRLAEPLMSGIYAGDGEQLSAQATFPQLVAMEREHGSLLRGAYRSSFKTSALPPSRSMVAQHPPGSRTSRGEGELPAIPTSVHNTSPFLTLRGGLSDLVDACVERLTAAGTDLRLHARVREIERGPRGQYSVTLESGEVLDAPVVILAVPAYAAAALLGALDTGLTEQLNGIPYVSTATVSLAYRASDLPRPLDATGYIIPRREGRPALACTFTSTKFAGRAPDGYALLRVFVGRAGQSDPTVRGDDELLQLARAELRVVLGITAAPVLERAFRWPRGLPQYNLGHLQRLAVIRRRLAGLPGLLLAGSAYEGVGLPACIASGEAAADAALRLNHMTLAPEAA